EKLGLQKLTWPANSLDLNLIEMIWTEMKDEIKMQLEIWMTASGIWEVVEQVWQNYPIERINHYILSMIECIEACIADEGGNCFNF
ncbi:hypothetical protein L873DRAFT_1701173, partial [Choiromyces venosus 120613-1]